MRDKKILTLLCLTVVMMLSGCCMDFDKATQPITVKIQVVMPDEYATMDVSGRTVTLALNGKTIAATTDDEGIVTFKDIVPDNYDISVAWKEASYTISGGMTSQLLAVSNDVPIVLNVSVQKESSWLISKVYYEGSKDSNNKNYMAGKYIEIFNNSSEPLDAAGLYIALMETESTIAYTPGQVEEVVYAKQVFRVPTTEAKVVQPGETLLLVNSAIDHTKTAMNAYERNLLDADYEAKDKQGKTTNNPDTPALELIYSCYPTISQMNIVQGGPTSMVIFSTNEDVSQWERVYAYGKTKGNMFMKIPLAVVTDGVEILKNRAQTGPDVNTKRLFDAIDAGYTYCSSVNGYSGETVYRMTAQVTADGRRVLQDTNNSLNDFQTSTTIKPREY